MKNRDVAALWFFSGMFLVAAFLWHTWTVGVLLWFGVVCMFLGMGMARTKDEG